jgi:uncharacterized repeat protein (TIGR01451 family)
MQNYRFRITGRFIRLLLAGAIFACFLVVLPDASTSRAPDRSADLTRPTAPPVVSRPGRDALLAPRLFSSRRFLKAGLSAPPSAPTVTATKSAALNTDVDNDGLFDPGDTIKYSVVVSASGMDATNVNFSDTLDTNTTFVNGSLAASPVAVDDTYPQTLVGNLSVDSSLIPYSVVSNDFLGVNPTATITAFDSTSAHGGTVSMTTSGAGIGQFTYNPPAGYEGTDTFTYTLSDQAGNPSALANRKATVTLTISGMVWFVNNTAGTNGDGRLSSPFNSLANFQAVNDGASNHPADNDNIFLYESGSAYGGPVTLRSGQKLIGQDATASLSTITGLTPPGSSPSFPVMNSGNATIVKITSGGNAINLTNGSTGNTIRGLTIGSTTGIGINGTNFGTLTVADVTMTDSPSRTGQALSLTTGTLTASFASIESVNSSATGISLTSVGGSLTSGTTTVTNPSGAGISVNTSSATLSFGPTSVTGSGGTGVSLTTNTGTITFGTTTITPDANQKGLVATENSNTITVPSGTITTSASSGSTNAAAVEISRSSSTTPLAIALTSVTASSGTNGIFLKNTSGSFTVNGDGSNTSVGGNNTGGTISNMSGTDSTTAGTGIYLENVTNITLRRVTINGTNQNYGIKGLSVNGFTLEYATVSGTNGTVATLGNPDQIGEGSIVFGSASSNGITGTGTFTNLSVSGARGSNLIIENSGAVHTTTVTVKGSTFGAIQNFSDGGHATQFMENTSGSTFNVIFGGTLAGEGNTITSAVGNSIAVVGAVSTTMDAQIRNNNISDNHAFNISGGGIVYVASSGVMTSHITGNTMRDANGSALTLFKATVGTSFISYVDNNTIGVAGSADSGSKTGNGIFVSAGGAGTMSFTITNNMIHQIHGNSHIYADNTGGSFTANFDIEHNTLDTRQATNFAGIAITNGSPMSSDTINVCAVIGGSTAAQKNTLNLGGNLGVIVGSSGAASGHTFNLPGYAGGANLTNVQNFIQGNNAGSFTTSAYTDAPATAAAFTGNGTNCGTPAASLPNDIKASATGPITDQADAGQATDQEAILRTAHSEGANGNNLQKLTPAELNWMVQAAIERWRGAGISGEDLARLEAATFEIADLPDGQLADASSMHIKIDETAASYGWFFDQTPQEDSEFLVPVPGRELQTTEYSEAHGKIDLLTVVMRQLGTLYLQGQKKSPKALRPLMEPTLSPGVRRLIDARTITLNLTLLLNHGAPERQAGDGSFISSASLTADQSSAAILAALPHFGLVPVAFHPRAANAQGLRYALLRRTLPPPAVTAFAPQSGMLSQAIGTLPSGKSTTVIFKAMINNPFPLNVCTVTNTAQVTGSNFSSINSNASVTNVAIPPAFSSCPASFNVNTDPNQCTASVSFAPTTTGCPVPTLTCKIGATTITSPFAFPKGVSSVTCTAHNTSGADATCSFNVTVTDNQAPSISCPAPITQATDPGLCTAVVSYITPTGSDNCPLPPSAVVCSPASGSVFPKGVTTVTCTVTDAANLTASCSFTVTVNDTTAPLVTCAPAGGAFVLDDCYPSNRMAFTGTSFYANNTINVVMTNPLLSSFSACTNLPASGSQAISFTATFAADVSINGGPATRMQAPASVALTATFSSQSGNTKTYTAQITQLDVSGGSFAATWQLRESPTLQSNGQITVTTISGGSHLDSVFDLFTELSTNSGSSWNSGTSSGHLAAVQNADAGACTAGVNYQAATATDNCDTVTPSCTPASGTTFAKGTTTVTCSATDSATPPNTGSCSFTVTVVDAQAPTLSCPANINVSSGGGCQTATYTTPSASDNCTGATVSCSPASGSCFAVGTTTVSCTATDTSGNTGQCSFTVTVTPCTISCPGNQTANAAAGTCAATVNYTAPTTTGTCGTVTCAPASGSSFAKGVTTVTCTTQSGPSCNFTVTVTDNQPPSITCPAPITQSTDPNLCTAVVSYTTPAGSDNCPLPANPVVCSPAAGTAFPKGVTDVTCIVTDGAGLTANCTFTVTVNDTQPPTITCLAPVSHATDSNVCTAVVTYSAPTVSDNCPNVGTPSCSPASGSTFQKGVTTVSCSVTDASNNTGQCSFTVTVNDMQAPQITCPSPITQNTDANACTAVVNYSQPSITDNCPCDVGSEAPVKGKGPQVASGCTVNCTPAAGTAFPKGATTVTCTGTDTSGNTANCSFTITVVDNQNPTVICPQPITQSTDPNLCTAVVTYATPSGSDNCTLPPNPVTCAPASGTTFQKGTTTVTCTVTDAASHTGQCSFTVTVNDTQKPAITCPGNVTVSNTSGQCTAVATFTLPTVSDNCAGVGTPTCAPASGSTFQAGLTTVTCTVSDASGNQQSCAFTVTVNDTQAPTLTCPAPVSHATDLNLCTAVVAYSAPSVSDNCSGVGTPICTPASGSTFPKGTTTVSCTVKDSSNNSANCSFTVTVNDTQKPTVTCPANVNFTTQGNADPCGVVTYATPSGSDNCAIQSVVCSPASGTCFPTGMTSVTCTATDTSGNTGQCSFKVTVQNPCAITCPANITKGNDANQCGAVTTFAPNITGGGCGTVTCTPASGSFFAKGTTTVNCKTQAGPSCSFTVTVNDTQPPAISCPANLTRGTDANACTAVVSYNATATDNCPGVMLACNPPSGSTFPRGTTTVSCQASDTSNNQSSCAFTVTVNDTQPPSFVNGCPPAKSVVAPLTCPPTTSQTVTYQTPAVTDNCAAATVACVPPSGSVFSIGTTSVTCTASDTSGNTASCSFALTMWTACLQDETNAGNVCLFNAQTGAYQFCCNGMIVASGTGTVTVRGCTVTISHIKQERRVQMTADMSARKGTATIIISGVATCQITDQNMANNSCQCPLAANQAKP